jgi:hypothetical protein
VTTYFEWSLAAWVQAEMEQPLRRLALRADHEALHLLVEGETGMQQLLAEESLSVVLQSPTGDRLEFQVCPDGCDAPSVRCGVGRVVELSLPWDGQPGHRLQVRLGACSLPEGAVLLVEPTDVDEERPAAGGG